MKKIFLSLFVAGAITFGLQSCGEEDLCEGITCPTGEICQDGTCVTDPDATTCDVCGTYNGSLTGYVYSDPDTLYNPTTPEVAPTIVSEVSGTYYLEINLEGLFTGLKPKVSGTYNASTKVLTITDAAYSFEQNGSTLDFLINGTADFNTTNAIDVNVTLGSPSGSTSNISGQLHITGTK
ncbi:MAG: hypothetical protein R2836_01160 [Chitinophagales bacterium]